MSLPLYFDHNVPASIAHGLRRMGVDVLRSLEDGTAEWDDDRILARGMELGRPIVTMDEDFLRLADDAWEAGIRFIGVVYISDANIRIGRAVDELFLLTEATSLDELESQVVYLPF